MLISSSLHETFNFIEQCATSVISYSPGGASAIISQNVLHALNVSTLMNYGRKIKNFKSALVYDGY